METKLLFALCALALIIVPAVFYILDMVRGRTKPHVYTWLIWSVTTGVAAAGVFYGHGGYPALTTAVGSAASTLIFFLSFTYGTKNITVSDTVALIFCLAAVGLWVFLKNPLGSVLLAAGIDIAAYWPTVRKTYVEPWSESLSSWTLWILAPVFSILALSSYNLFTLANYVPIVVVNVCFLALCLIRRRMVPKP